MDEALRRTVVERANRACEYCHLPETISFLPFQFDHIIAQKHHGITDESNLAWVCYYCNSYKGPNIAGQDRLTSTIVRLFHPRQDVWESHFEWQNAVPARPNGHRKSHDRRSKHQPRRGRCSATVGYGARTSV
jgi:hypothetical protein